MVGDTEARLGTAAIVFIMLCVVGTCVMIGRQGTRNCSALRTYARALTYQAAEEQRLHTPEEKIARELERGAWSDYLHCRDGE